MPDLDTFVQSALLVIGAWTPKVLGALAVLVLGFVFAGWAKRLVRTAMARANADAILVPFVSGVVHVGLLVAVTIAAVSTMGVSTTSFVAVIGAAGLAIALAFQDTFSNFAAGVMLLTFRPFEVGNFVEVGGVSGTVKGVGIFSCVLDTPDNIQIRIPNSRIFGQTIKNFHANPERRIDLVMGVSYDDDLGVAIRTCLDVIAADPRVLADPAPFVAVGELGASSVDLLVRPWVKRADYLDTRTDLLRALKENLEAAGCSIPYPQRDVHLHQVG